jgi:hypothetical protein
MNDAWTSSCSVAPALQTTVETKCELSLEPGIVELKWSKAVELNAKQGSKPKNDVA